MLTLINHSYHWKDRYLIKMHLIQVPNTKTQEIMWLIRPQKKTKLFLSTNVFTIDFY